MDKIIFLDIDGVMATEFKEVESDNRCKFEGHAVKMLNLLISRSNAKIVISSTWRHGQTVEDLQNIFKLRGFKHPEVIIDKTPNIREHDYICR